ncbi:MAG TPA: hypothetical protein VEL76_12300 [Gemmataceae bacterium]|nr:hypothetical protein [Gemmataceae bacterium]
MKCNEATAELLDYPDYVEQLRRADPGLAATFAAFTGLESVLTWLNQSSPTAGGVDIVGMDEFHYDFLVRLDGGRWAAFGVT